MSVNRRIVIISVLSAFSQVFNAGAGDFPQKQALFENAREKMQGILGAISGGDLNSGRAGLDSLFLGADKNKKQGGAITVPVLKQNDEGLVRKTAAGDGDVGWPPSDDVITFPVRKPQRPDNPNPDPKPEKPDTKPKKPDTKPDPKPKPTEPDRKPSTSHPA